MEFERVSRRVDADAAERALHRALAIDEHDQVDGLPELMTVDDVVAIGAELGLDPHTVRQALAEERLVSQAPTPDHLLDRLAGAGLVSVSRAVPLPASTVLARLDAWCRSEHALRPVRHNATSREWMRRRDVVGRVRRATKAASGGASLGRIRRLAAVVEPVDARSSVVLLVADVRDRRVRRVTTGTAVAGAGVAGAVAIALALSPVGLVVLGAGAAGGVAAAATHRRTVHEVEHELEALLDAVAAHRRPTNVLDALGEAARRQALGPGALSSG